METLHATDHLCRDAKSVKPSGLTDTVLLPYPRLNTSTCRQLGRDAGRQVIRTS